MSGDSPLALPVRAVTGNRRRARNSLSPHAAKCVTIEALKSPFRIVAFVASALLCAACSTTEKPPAPAMPPVENPPPAARVPRNARESLADANLQFTSGPAPFLREYCLSCHHGNRAKADLDLASIQNGADAITRRADLARAREKVASGKMPPPERRQPDPGVRANFIHQLQQLAEITIPENEIPPGRVVARRLNRYEYDRTISDLFGVHYDSTRTFPADPGGHGFDNIGDVASVTPLILEKYFDAAREITDEILNLQNPPFRISGDAGGRAEIARLLSRAFRRPPATGELESRLDLHARILQKTGDEREAARALYNSVLLAPAFLFRLETGGEPGADGVARLTNHEIANRLSYFLWSTMPDEELYQAAESPDFTNPEVLRAQLGRMLKNPKARALADHFGSQWLRYREILDRAVDFRRYPKFNDTIRRAMYEECARFFDSITRESRPVYEILDSRETYLNEPLAALYEIGGVKGGSFVKITFPDRRRGGMLTMGAILTLTSYPLRTSPVLRGKFLLEQILNDPPPPPPPGVPKLPTDDVQPDKLTLRARLERHRADAACAACHNKIDPPGLALENFDGMGVWRDRFQDAPIDTKTTMPDGAAIEGAAGLRDYLISQKDRFVRAFAERLFTYAVGRPVDGNDEELMRAMVDKCNKSGGSFEKLAAEIVLSRPFLNIQKEVRSDEPQPPQPAELHAAPK